MLMHSEPVDPGDLALFVRVVDAGSVTRAADAQYITQPAVTQRLRRLERVLGAPLLERRGRGVGITEAGRVVLPLARQVLQTLERIPDAVSEIRGSLRGEMVLGASTTVGEFILPKRLGAFARAYPHVAVRLQIAGTQRIVDRVVGHHLALGFVGLRPPHTALVAMPFVRDEIVLVASSRHPLARGRVSADDLSRARVLLREEGSATRALAVAALVRCGVSTESLKEFGSNAALRTAVLAGYGVAAISQEVVAEDLLAGKVKPLRLPGWHCRRRFYIIYRRDHTLTGGEEILLRFLRRPQPASGDSAPPSRISKRARRGKKSASVR